MKRKAGLLWYLYLMGTFCATSLFPLLVPGNSGDTTMQGFAFDPYSNLALAATTRDSTLSSVTDQNIIIYWKNTTTTPFWKKSIDSLTLTDLGDIGIFNVGLPVVALLFKSKDVVILKSQDGSLLQSHLQTGLDCNIGCSLGSQGSKIIIIGGYTFGANKYFGLQSYDPQTTTFPSAGYFYKGTSWSISSVAAVCLP